jgi:DNA-binding beta-propeller fold protein YncE
MPKLNPVQVVLAAALVSCAAASAAPVPYQVGAKWLLGGDGGWDDLYADSASHLLYVSRATHVIVVDTETGKIVADIADAPGVHGIAIAADLKRGFISAGRADQVKVFDLATRAPLASIAVGSNPDAIVYEPATKKVLAFNGRSADVSVIDAGRAQVLATLALDGKPEFARADGRGKVFVNLEDKNQLAVLDAGNQTILGRWHLPRCDGPSGLALDAAHHRSFSACSNAVMTILDTETGRAVTTLPIGKGVDGAAFDPVTGDAFASNGEGSVTVIHETDPEHFVVAQTLLTARGARTVALDAERHTLYLPSAEFGEAPPANAPGAHPRPPILPGTFFLLSVRPVDRAVAH